MSLNQLRRQALINRLEHRTDYGVYKIFRKYRIVNLEYFLPDSILKDFLPKWRKHFHPLLSQFIHQMQRPVIIQKAEQQSVFESQCAEHRLDNFFEFFQWIQC